MGGVVVVFTGVRGRVGALVVGLGRGDVQDRL
jgi:hypothetical protein